MRTLRSGVVAMLMTSGALLGAGVAAAAPPPTTPGETGGGCRENGQTISEAARTLTPFGQLVKEQAPIADDNAAFFTLLCSDG
jgi:hypothetical protein